MGECILMPMANEWEHVDISNNEGGTYPEE